MLSKVYILSTLAMFGLSFQPLAYANEQTPNATEVNLTTRQTETYTIRYKDENDTDLIFQAFTSHSDYLARLSELHQSELHHVEQETLVRNQNNDIYMTTVIIKQSST